MGASDASGGGNPLAGWQYGDVSVAEDVSEIIYQITPTDTPVYNSIGDTRSSHIYHQWQTRSLSTRSQTNAQLEGFTYTFTAQLNTPDARRVNYTQIFNKRVRVTETEGAVRHYAIDDAFQDQMLMRMAEIKTDIETTIVLGTLVSGVTGTAQQLQGVINAIVSAQSTFSQHGAVTTSLTEALFNDAIQVCWQLGGKPKDWYANGNMKRRISVFASNSTKYIAAEAQKTVNTISVYQSDFFVVNMHLSRDVPAFKAGTIFASVTANSLLGLDTTMMRKAWLRPLTAERVPKTADSYDGVIKAEATLEYGHPNAHFYIAGSY